MSVQKVREKEFPGVCLATKAGQIPFLPANTPLSYKFRLCIAHLPWGWTVPVEHYARLSPISVVFWVLIESLRSQNLAIVFTIIVSLKLDGQGARCMNFFVRKLQHFATSEAKSSFERK
jgi:hypothetical protein